MRSKFNRIALAAVFFWGALASAATAAGVTVTYETQGRELFSFSVPDDWQVLTGFEVSPSAVGMARIVSVLPVGIELVMWTGLWAPPEVHRLEEPTAYVVRLRREM
jgi:hypothetical protein